ncbi:hypothetical protein HYV89_00385 [Candidatus Woesearchaeota archaeon]|nr:hypothetical protein [Candidatus Woesearchaeota archaeon]
MALFKKKRDDMKQKIKPPTFPGLPEHNFPTYEPAFPSSLDNIKRAVQDIPDFEREERPLAIPEEKAIFVKIDKYKEAIDTLEIIKEKLKTAQAVLNELKELKRKEEAELEEWQGSINDIKEKLTLVDNNLFEI